MKVDFIKEEKLNGDVFYYTNIDNCFIDNSLSMDSEKAMLIHEKILSGTFKHTITVVRTSTIENAD